jgi:hypothetical protein
MNKNSFSFRLIQCEINTTLNLFFPAIIHPYQNLPLSEQAIYDLKNMMRKSNEINDFDDDDDYNEDDEIEIDNQLTTSIESTTSKIEYNTLQSSSSSSRCVSKFIYLLLLLLFLIQTNK